MADIAAEATRPTETEAGSGAARPEYSDGRRRHLVGDDVSRPRREVGSAGSKQVTIRLPTSLRRLAGDRRAIQVDADLERQGEVSVGAALAALARPYPGVHDAVLDELGAVRRHVNVFVGVENIRFCAGLATPVPSGVEVSILPAVSGG